MPRYPFPPMPATLPPFPIDPPLEVALVDLTGLWLRIRCGHCGTRTDYPLRKLAAERGWQTRLADVLPKFRCSKVDCGDKRPSIELIASPQAGAHGNSTAPGPSMILQTP